MKKLFYPLTLLALLFVQMGCESHHQDENIQEQQDEHSSAQDDLQKPHIENEHGGNSGNR